MNRRWMMAVAACAALSLGFASASFAEDSKPKDEPAKEKKDDAKKSDKPEKKKEAKPVNKFCAVEQDQAVDPTVTTTYDGKVVGFCCEDCIKTFKKNPKKYMKSLK